MSTSVLMLASEGAETMHELPMPAYMYAVIAIALFALGLAVVWFFRGTAAKYGSAHLPDDADGHEHGTTRGSHH
ncbi:hypothetical protein [Nostocoides australiense]|nr:hypothetical protein [Tetrasphaera australiensis]MCA0291219.1 hypothetical protein [Actinomycetota bacterium]MCB1300787.1 hypothetical protein [Tetrasphaera sp.]HPF81784.1 hypothetical protein [Tetrasphaera australiensis]HRW01753.1 hypothetical protein [Tetrasphaera sp.]